MPTSKQTSTPRPSSPPLHRDVECCSCGHRYIGGPLCPSCSSLSKSSGEEIVRKTFDTPDLKKGW